MTPYRRPCLLYPILGRAARHDVSVAALSDFLLGPASPLPEPVQAHGLLPWWFDAAAERLVCTQTPDLEPALAAAFLYQGQFATAAKLVAVPLERLAEFGATGDSDATFIFSASRCGTTLLARLLRATGQPSASEPDVFTLAAMLPAAELARLGEPGMHALLGGSTGVIAQQLGQRVFIKLRNHCNGIAVPMLRAAPGARAVMLLRGRIGWARSRHRAFQDSPVALGDMLKGAVMAFDALAQDGHAPLLLWYEDLVVDPAGTLMRLGVPVGAGEAASIAEVMQQDLQQGTSLARHGGGPELSAEDLRRFEAHWAAIAPREALRRHGMARLLPENA